ncbi:MAG: PEP-CTERM sorting domain-containing protein [Planctomycetota bacterium]
MKIQLYQLMKIQPIPEPTTIALLGIGLVGLAGAEARRRRKKKAVDKS